MREFKPTEGPWRIDESLSTFDIRGPEDEFVAVCYKDEQWGFLTTATANSQLIASAPTMYRKLKDTVEWLKREGQLTGEHTKEGLWRLQDLQDDLAETLRKIEEGA